jgi:hypothetical protein
MIVFIYPYNPKRELYFAVGLIREGRSLFKLEGGCDHEIEHRIGGFFAAFVAGQIEVLPFDA